jgi:indolepyruvate ferredoxin oxidoreductase
MVYDQTCAAEKRRRRKRGTYPDPDKRVFINDLVCEGCGDCGEQSNCVSIVPQETEFGTKRAIDQSSCNKDFSCLKGFCPSFVTVEGAKIRKAKAGAKGGGADAEWGSLPDPDQPALSEPYGIVVTGVGGTGVVTIGALLGMAAHIEGKGCSVLDMTGLAQKGGAVVSHVRIAEKPEDIHAVRVSAGGARLLLGCDLVTAAGKDALAKVQNGQTRAVINGHETVTGEFTRNPDYVFPGKELHDRIEREAGEGQVDFLEATDMATALMGDSIATNLFMLGYAWQKGLVPISKEALDRAIELNGVAIEANKQAFEWGRRAAVDLAAVAKLAEPQAEPPSEKLSQTTEEMIERRVDFLTDYQDAAYAARYKDLVDRVSTAEKNKTPALQGLTEAVAKSAFKLMAYKDEYEVARLYTNGEFMQKLRQQFDGDFKLTFHLAPPALADRDASTGHLKKKTYGPWMLKAFGLLARLKRLRETPFDPFGYSDERKMERRLRDDYVALVQELIDGLNHDNHALAVEIAELPQKMRGFGHIKQANVEKAKAREAELLQHFRNPAPTATAAE